MGLHNKTQMNNLKVNCYAGHTYAQRPVSFTLEGKEYEVKEVEKEWLEPGERCFIVRTSDNKTFRFCYNEAKDQWSLIEAIHQGES